MKPVMNKIKVTETCGLNPFFCESWNKTCLSSGILSEKCSAHRNGSWGILLDNKEIKNSLYSFYLSSCSTGCNSQLALCQYILETPINECNAVCIWTMFIQRFILYSITVQN